MRPWFVTATGTDVGKTHVLCLVLEALRRRGVRVQALKPVLSGFVDEDLAATDSGRLLSACGTGVDAPSVARVTPWRFVPALSPDMAAMRAGTRISLEQVAGFCAQSLDPACVGFVEGAGGIMSPLGTGFLNIDLAARLEARILLVAGAYLGTISHTLTAVSALASRGLRPAAIVLSEAQPGPVPLAETQQAIRLHVEVPVYGVARDGSVPDALVDIVMAG